MKTLKTLQEFKKQMRELYLVSQQLTKVWNEPKYTTVSVLVQNISVDGSDYKDYCLEADLKRVRSIIKALSLLADYNKECHVTNFIFDEVSMCYSGYSMCEDV